MALIATGERGEEPSPLVAGRSLVLRQFDFAQAWGAERIIAYGNGTAHDALALRHEADKTGTALSAIASAHALVALVEWTDTLLVLQPGLLPESPMAIAALDTPRRILALPSAGLRLSGWERIDAANLWAGALTMPGTLVDKLEQLGEDADPHAALLRIALQSLLPLERLSRDALEGEAWLRVTPEEDGNQLARDRARGRICPETTRRPSRRLTATFLTRFAAPLVAHDQVRAAALALALGLPVAGISAAWWGFAAAGFMAIALGVMALNLALDLDTIGRPAFQRRRIARWLDHLPDLALLVTGVLAIDGAWYRRLFVPLVLVVCLRAIRRHDRWRDLASDRALGALFVAGGVLAGVGEPALMAWALVALTAALALPGEHLSSTEPPSADEAVRPRPSAASELIQRSETGT